MIISYNKSENWYFRANDPIPYSDYTLVVNLLEGRPGVINQTLNEGVQAFLQASQVRIKMQGHPYVTFKQHKYHAIKEIQVNAR